MATELELIDSLRETTLSPAQETIVDELETLLKQDVLWHDVVREAAQAAFGGQIHNPNSTQHKQIDRRVRHLMRVWRSRYEMNYEQHVYAGALMAWALKKGRDDGQARLREARGEAAKKAAAKCLFSFPLKELESLCNAPQVHAGMMRRATPLVDVSEQLAELYG